MTTPTGGPGSAPPPEPKPLSSSTKSLGPNSSPSDAKDAFLLNSPFAKMFKATGAMPTVKEMKIMIDGILKSIMATMKEQDAQNKKVSEHLKRVIEGDDD